MKRKFNLKTIILTSVFTVALILLGTTDSQAVLQANPTTHASPVSKTGETWITSIRQMETVGQTMGLTETLNGLESSSGDNGIDVHMMLPTEYGAVAILSASGYGNSGMLRDETDAQKRTTTGNSTGVYFTGDRWEKLAGYSNATVSKYLQASDNVNNVFSSIQTWHGGSQSTWKCQVNTTGDWGAPITYHVGATGIFGLGLGYSDVGANYKVNSWTRMDTSFVCK